MLSSFAKFLFLLMAVLSREVFAAHPNYKEVMAKYTSQEISWNRLPLRDERGKTFTGDEHKGKLILIDFFFTSCPNICPPETAGLVKVWDKLGEKEKRSILFLSVSIDPQNDTPAKLNDYKKRFGIRTSSWIFATTSQDNVNLLTRYFGARHGDSQRLDHKGRIYVVSPEGLYLTSFASTPLVESSRVASELTKAVHALIKSGKEF